MTLDARGPHARAAATAFAARSGVRIVRTVPQIGLVAVAPRRGTALSLHQLAERLRARDGVVRVSAERRFSLRYAPNDPALREPELAPGTPPGTPVEWWVTRENFPAAWDLERGDGATVAVIDTGVDGSHPELAPRITAAVDLDDDPTHGPATTDEAGHGTHVSSLACATADNGVGITGAGLDCSLLVYKTDLSDSSVAAAIVGATDHGAEAINMSFGTDGSRPASREIVSAIDYAYRHDVVMAAAAADDPVQEQGDPANVLQPTGTGSNITQGKGLSVTAATVNDTRASFAGYGSQISIAAYGAWQSGSGGPRGILGAFPASQTDLERPVLTGGQACNCRTTFDGDTRYAYLQGTSMATPMVTATAALMRHLNPDLSAATVIRLLKQTARRPAGQWTADLGWGILDAGAALAATRTTDARAPTSSVRAPRTTHRRSVTLRLRSHDAAPAGCVASGVAKVRVYRRTHTGHWRRIATTRKSTLKVRVTRGRSYAFYTVAVDKAGNREAVPRRPDARVRAR